MGAMKIVLSAGSLANCDIYYISVQIQLILFKHVTSKNVYPPPKRHFLKIGAVK